MKEDAQLICPVAYEDKNEIWPVIQKFICDRLPLKDVTWRSSISSSFINIERLPLRFLPSSARLFNETQHPYRRFLAPYVHIYLLCAESMDVYKSSKAIVKKWMEPYKLGKQPWIIVYVPLGTSTMDVYNKVYARISNDFYTEKSGDHSVMLIIPPDGSRRSVSTHERTGHQYLFQQAYAALTDLLGKLRDGVVTSFQMRTAQYDADIRRLDIPRGTPNFDFWQLFLVKESLALMYQMLQLPDRALGLYEELDALLPFAPYHSLPTSEWPMVVPTLSTSSAQSGPGASPSKLSGQSRSSSNVAADNEVDPSRDEGSGRSPSKSSSNSRNNAARKDLMSDACRCGEDIVAYSINQARMNILWNRLSFFQLQHYLFARQMYFLLVHLRQPTRCAEKALTYMRTASTQLEKHLRKVHVASAGFESSPSAGSPSDTLNSAQESKDADEKLLQLRLAQADVWALMGSLKLIRECRALLQLLVGGDETYQSLFHMSSSTGSSGGAVSGLSYSQNSVPSAAQESFQDNLAAISSASAHGSSVVYSSLAELSRSQHGISNVSSTRKPNAQTTCGGTPGLPSPLSAAGSALSPAAALRDVLFSPDLDIDVEVRDSSRVLGELIEFALQRLQSLSSSTVKNAGQKALDLVLSAEPFSLENILEKARLIADEAVTKRVVTRVNPNVPSGDFAAAANVTSPKNVDLVLSIEQELSMLDESRETEGIAGVGDRMDQILLSISQKVRSTSHFWAKLYEVSTPAHLLLPSSATEADREGQRARVESNDSASPGGSPFGSRVATPIGSPAPGAGFSENIAGRQTRKMISRHSSRSLVMSKSQLERGKLLELCLAVLGCSAQWHLQLLANRPRFALSAMLRCADLLLCNGQLAVAAKRLEEALRSGLLAPVAAYIGVERPSWRSSDREAARCSVFQRCLADKQLHQQQETQHRNLDFTATLASEHTRAYPLHGAWALLWHWTLRKLMYCMQETGQWARHRVVLANLLMPTSADGLTRLPLQPQSLLADVLEQFVALSKIPTRLDEAPHTHAVQVAEGIAVPAEMEPAESDTPASMPLLQLPLSSYFDVEMGMVRPLKADAMGSDPRLVQGFEVVREEWLPVSAMQCEGGREGGYCLPITLHSKLPGPLPVDSLFVVYKRFTADTIVTQTISAGESSEEGGTNATLDQLLAIREDEFVCRSSAVSIAESSCPQLLINPGSQSFCLAFQPAALGEYRLDRIMLVVGTALFEAHMLPEVCLSNAQREYSQHQHQYAGPGESLALREDMFSSPGLAHLALLDTLDAPHLAENSGGPRVYSVGESAALAALKTYFAQHSIIKVMQPPDLLFVNAAVASCLPLFQSDDTYFTAETSAGDELEDLVVRVWGDNPDTNGTRKQGPYTGEDSRSNSANISLSLSNGASTHIVGSSHQMSGFVPQDQATPAAMRRRLVDPADEDEELAMANAAAAVASLLAQQAEESSRAARRRGSRDNAAEEGTELVVAETSEWRVVATSLSNAGKDKSPLVPTSGNVATPASDNKQQQRILNIGAVEAETRLHFRIPICVGQADNSLLNQSTCGGDALLHFELTGRLCRAGCVIPVVVRKTLAVHATPMTDLQLYVHQTARPHGSISSTGGEVLVQAELRNNTGEGLELTGFGASFAEETALDLVDGPVDLPVLMNGVAVPIAATAKVNTVSLLPAELYLAGLMLQYATSNSAMCGTVDFYLQRSSQLLDGKVHSCIYRHNSFVVRRGLTLGVDKMPSSVSAAAVTRDVLGVSDRCLISSGCLRLFMKALTTAKHAQLGRVYTCTMLLSVGFAVPGVIDTASTAVGVGYRYRSCSACSGHSCASLTDLPGSPVYALDVTLCETEGWVAVGHTRRVLTACALTPVGIIPQKETPNESYIKQSSTGITGDTATLGADASNSFRDSGSSSSALVTNWVEVQYELQWEMLPVTLGRLALPPLHANYSLRPDQVHTPSSIAPTVTSATLYPSKLDGDDVVEVLPIRPPDTNCTGESRRGNGNVVVCTSLLASYCTL